MQPHVWWRAFGRLLAAAGLAFGMMLGAVTPASASAPIILSGSQWFGGNGVNVCADSTDPYCGSEYHVGGWSGNWWQCVEMAQRLYQKLGWYGGIFPGVDYAYQIYDQASAMGMSRQANGSVGSIVPGDMIIHGADIGGGAGHVSIVDSINGSTVNAVEQNASSTGRATYSLSSGTLSRPGMGTIRGVVHDPDNVRAHGAASDFTGDGRADLLWYEANVDNGRGKVFETNDSGSGIEVSHTWFTGFAKPDWAGSGDFSGDGKTDIAWYEESTGRLKVFMSNGNGLGTSYTWATGFAKPDWAAVDDFTGDGKADIAWYENANNGTIKVFATNGSGNGVSSSHSWVTGYGSPRIALTGDFTGDGKADIMWYETLNGRTGKVIVTNGNGTGVAGTNTWFTDFAPPTEAIAGDFTGDGKDDLGWYEANAEDGRMKVFPSTGSGLGQSITWFTGFAPPTEVAASDFTGDGRADLLWYEANVDNGRGKVFETNDSGSGIEVSHTWFTGFKRPNLILAG